MFLVKDMVLYEYSRKFVENPVGWGGRMRHVGNIMRHPFRLATFGTDWLKRRTFAERKLPLGGARIAAEPLRTRIPRRAGAERRQPPHPVLRVRRLRHAAPQGRLARDRAGPRQPGASWTCWRANWCSAREQLDFDREKLAFKARRHGIVGGHHIGTTRMSVDPRQGVVDADYRVHGVANLYVASASVFPTSGQANPT